MKALTTTFALFFLSIGLHAEGDKPAHSAVSPAQRSGGWMNRHEAFNQRGA